MENKEVKTKQVKLTKDERFAEMCVKEVVKNILSTINSMEKGVWTGKKSMAIAPSTVKNIVAEVTKGLEAIDVTFIKDLKETFVKGESITKCLETQEFPKKEISKQEELETKAAFEDVTGVKINKKEKKNINKSTASKEVVTKTVKSSKTKKETEKPKKETKTKKTKKSKK